MLQVEIMQFAKKELFHATIEDFLIQNPQVEKEEALEALKGLKRMRVCSVGPSMEKDWIGATNKGWKVMGWED